jgi:HAD superfamily hydrolase (TIGR01509 family)
MPVKVVLLDLDDTLFDHEYSCRRGMVAVKQATPFFAGHTADELDRDSSIVFDILWPQVLAGTLTLEAWQIESFRLLFAHYSETADDKMCVEAAHCYRAAYQESRRAVNGAVRLLETLKPRVQVGIVTNHVAAEQLDKLNVCGLNHLVDFMICPETAGAPKPDARMFRAALDMAKCGPSEAVMLGDSWSSDVIGAAQAGIRAVWYNPNQRPCPEPVLAAQITAFEPLEPVIKLLLGN